MTNNSKTPAGVIGPKIWLALVVLWVVWGSTYLAIRYAVETIPPFYSAAMRFLVAGGTLYIWRRWAGDPAPTRLHWRSAAIIGVFLLVGGNGGVTWAEQRVASGIAALIVSSSPLWMVLIDALRPNGRRPNWQTGFGIVLGLGGIGALVGPELLQSGGGGLQLDLIGSLVLMLSAIFWAIGTLYSREAHLPDSPLLGTAMEMLVACGGLLVVGTLAGEHQRFDIGAVSTTSLFALGYLVVFGSWIGFATYTWLVRVAPTPLVGTYAYVNPVIAILIGNLLAAEPVNARLVIAALIIAAAVALITTGQRKPAQ